MGDRIENLINRPFKIGDLIVALIVFLVALCSFFAVGGGASNKIRGVEAYLGDSLVLTGDFDRKTFTVMDSVAVEVVNGDTVKITSEKGYNLITVDWDGGTLSVTDTDCGTSRECTMMDFKMGVIICSPHGLTVKALGEIPPPVVG